MRLILAKSLGTRRQLLKLGYDRSMVDAAATLVQCGGESVCEYAPQVASCQDPDLLAVAVAAIDEDAELLRDMLSARKEGAVR